MKQFLLFVLLFITVSTSQAQERDLAVESASPTANTFVLLIGINKYPPEIPSLEYCVRDTEGLARSMKKIGVPEEQIVVMVDDAEKVSLRPSRSNIIRQIEMVTDLVTENDQLVVTFSGHGAQLDGQAYLCPNDTDLERLDSFLSRKWVYDKLENCKARKKLFITDACRNEIKVRGSRSIMGVKSLADPLGDADSYGFALLASCSQNQKSYEDARLKHGVFTYFIMRGLEGEADTNRDGLVTLEELYDYVWRNTRQHVLRTRQAAQVPMRGGETAGNFVLASVPVTVSPPEIFAQPIPEPPRRTDVDKTPRNYTLDLRNVQTGDFPKEWDGPNNAEVNNVRGSKCLTNNAGRVPATLTITNEFSQPWDFMVNFTWVGTPGKNLTCPGTILDENGNSISFAVQNAAVNFGDSPRKNFKGTWNNNFTITRRGNILSMTCQGLQGEEITMRSNTFGRLTGFSITIPGSGVGVSTFSVRSLAEGNRPVMTPQDAAFQSRELALDLIETGKIRYTTPRGDRRRAPVTIVSAGDKEKCREFIKGEQFYVAGRFSEAKMCYENFLKQYNWSQ